MITSASLSLAVAILASVLIFASAAPLHPSGGEARIVRRQASNNDLLRDISSGLNTLYYVSVSFGCTESLAR